METYEIITSLCNSRGITVGKMCNDLGLRQALLSDLKSGRARSLSSGNLLLIANYFNVSVDYLLGVKHVHEEDLEMAALLQRFKDNPGQRLLFDKTKNATPEQLQAIANMIDAFMKN